MRIAFNGSFADRRSILPGTGVLGPGITIMTREESAVAGVPPASPSESAELIRALAAHPDQMATLIQALHGRAVTSEALLDAMGRLSREAVRILGGVDRAGVIARLDGPAVTVAGTDHRVLMLDDRQFSDGDGPGLQAVRTGAVVAMDVTQLAVAWPVLAHTALRAGIGGVMAVPIHLDSTPVGALNLYSASPAVPTPDPDLLTVLTEYAQQNLSDFITYHPPPVAAAALHAAVAQWTVVEHAIRLLRELYGFGNDYALDVLTDQAHDWNRTLPDQAAHVIANLTPPH